MYVFVNNLNVAAKKSLRKTIFLVVINHPKTDSTNSQSLTTQIMAFNSPPITRDPQHNKPANHKNTRVQKTTQTRTGNKPIPDPKPTQTRPEKKPKTYDVFSHPTHNPTGPVSNQEAPADLDAHGEKKRRREEENVDNPESLKEDEHFLTAGPGSQACRDQ
jgi:hypothetical protein